MSRDTAVRILTPALVVAALISGLAVGARWHERIEAWLPTPGTHAGDPPHVPASPTPVWTCPMHPDVLSDKQGRCPVCGMELAPAQPTTAPGGLRDEPADAPTHDHGRFR